MKIAIINGPNINLLGKREINIYGSLSFNDFFKTLQERFPDVRFSSFQSNIEGKLIDSIQKFGENQDAIILNAASYTHTSIGIADAISAISIPVIEVHISNVWAREEYRHTSYISSKCVGVIAGFGLQSYALAVQSIIDRS